MKSEIIVTEDELPADVLEAIKSGRKIEAIKILRETTGLGLANAKVLVDKAWRTHGPKKQVLDFSDQPRGLGGFGKFLLLLLVAIAAYFFYTAP